MRKKSNIEKQNDALLFWETFGPIIYRIAGIILIGGLIAAGFAIKRAIDRHNERAAVEQMQDLTTQRQEIVDKYIENNPNTFGTVIKQWNSGSLFYVESKEYGEFTIAFEGTEVTKIFVENKAGQIVTLYERTE